MAQIRFCLVGLVLPLPMLGVGPQPKTGTCRTCTCVADSNLIGVGGLLGSSFVFAFDKSDHVANHLIVHRMTKTS